MTTDSYISALFILLKSFFWQIQVLRHCGLCFTNVQNCYNLVEKISRIDIKMKINYFYYIFAFIKVVLSLTVLGFQNQSYLIPLAESCFTNSFDTYHWVTKVIQYILKLDKIKVFLLPQTDGVMSINHCSRSLYGWIVIRKKLRRKNGNEKSEWKRLAKKVKIEIKISYI